MGIDVKKDKYVFISYSSKNQQMADSVRLLLEENEISCWMAPNDIPAGSKYASVINDALENCSCLLLLLTNASQMSQYVELEVNRAIACKKPVLPMQLEDLELNSDFKLYLSNSQIVAVPEISVDAPGLQRVLAGIKGILGSEEMSTAEQIKPSVKTVEQTKLHARTGEKKSCRMVIFSPVNVDVYLEDKKHFVMHIDRNNGFDYAINSVVVGENFSLIFSGKSFEKEFTFERPDNGEFEYHLKTALSDEEIKSSYDREEAIARIKKDPTGYAFDQLATVGEEEDIEFLHEWLLKKSIGVAEADSSRNYLIAKCAVALGELSIKYRSFECAADIPKVYDKYKAKKSYGPYFDDILNKLSTAMNEKFIDDHWELYQKAEDGDPAAQYELGEAYADKNSAFKDHEKAFEWFLKSAENGHAKGMRRVAALYNVGLGCGGKDAKKEQYWNRKAKEEETLDHDRADGTES